MAMAMHDVKIELDAINAAREGFSILDNPYIKESPEGTLWEQTYVDWKKIFAEQEREDSTVEMY